MTSLEMVQYKRTDDMDSLYLMLANESSIYELWHDTATCRQEEFLPARK